MTLRAIIFDVDGTLAETEEAHRDAFNRAFAEAGLDWHWDEALYRRLLEIGGGRELIVAFARDHVPGFLDRAGAGEAVTALHARKTAFYREWLDTGEARLRPGVERLIGEARTAGVKLGIATTSRDENVTGLLRRTLGPDGPGRFDVIAAAAAAQTKKPAPDVYRHATRALGFAPADCLAIEDSAIGLQAAQAAGIPTVITEYFYTAGEEFDGALAVVSDLGDAAAPCRFVRGDANGKSYVDLDLLMRWHAGD